MFSKILQVIKDKNRITVSFNEITSNRIKDLTEKLRIKTKNKNFSEADTVRFAIQLLLNAQQKELEGFDLCFKKGKDYRFPSSYSITRQLEEIECIRL